MVWQAIGYYMVMYMASMSAVPISLYESANLDGAGRLTQFFQITIPLIWTNIRTTLTFFIISTINMAFLFVKAMTSGGPNGASDVALSYMYSQKDAGLYGYSMAIGVVIFLFSFALSACVNQVSPTAIRWNFKEGRRCRIPPKNLPALRKVCTSFSSILCWFCWPLPSSCRWHGCSWPPSSRMQSSTATRGHCPPGSTGRTLSTHGTARKWANICSTRSSSPRWLWRCCWSIALPAAYCLSRFHFKGCKVLNTLFMAGLFINVNYIVVPIFLMLRDGDVWLKSHFGSGFLLNNLVVLAVVYAATALPFTIYLLSGYFATLPHDFEEAAYIDGASYFSTMTRIIFPMAKPSIITIILFNFLSFWNEYIISMTLMSSTKRTPYSAGGSAESDAGAAERRPVRHHVRRSCAGDAAHPDFVHLRAAAADAGHDRGRPERLR